MDSTKTSGNDWKVGVGVGVSVGVSLGVGVSVGVDVGVALWIGVGVAVAVKVGPGVSTGGLVGLDIGVMEGVDAGGLVANGVTVAFRVPTAEGVNVGVRSSTAMRKRTGKKFFGVCGCAGAGAVTCVGVAVRAGPEESLPDGTARKEGSKIGAGQPRRDWMSANGFPTASSEKTTKMFNK